MIQQSATAQPSLDHAVVERWLGEPAQEIEEMHGGLFNSVFRARGQNHEVFVKLFADSAKDPAFPALPTSATERGYIAAVVNQLADTVPCDGADIRSARLIASDRERHAVVVESVPGAPLQTFLVDPAALGCAREAVLVIAAWLRRFHETAQPSVGEIADAAMRFKAYKSDLQYYRMLEHIPEALRANAREFADSHVQNSDSVILGDLNSRNVIVDFPQIRIIDFEQGQIGDGAHDLAYLVSELVIADIAASVDAEADIGESWKRYSGRRDRANDSTEISFRRHLTFQVLYRLKGPSWTAWSGHLSESVRDDVLDWCSRQFRALF
jgi:aminoglycoside phosphotransferase (APT) family kinase protein